MNIISTWICLDEVGEESSYPQVGGDSSAAGFQAVYWRCVFCFFFYSIRHNPTYSYYLFVNQELDSLEVDGVEVIRSLQELGVKISFVPFTYKLPIGYYGSWRNQMYEFDVFKYCLRHFGDDDMLLLLDSDCIITKPLDGLFQLCSENGCLTYKLSLPETYVMNGITRLDMKELYEILLGRSISEVPDYHAGEFAMFTIKALKIIMEKLDSAFLCMLDRFSQGMPVKFNEEAQFLSYLYYANGISGGEANSYIKRLWNAAAFYNITPNDRNLHIWHVPAAKKAGIPKLFSEHGHLGSLNNEELIDKLHRVLLEKSGK
jgi:hypothetical protein